MLCRPGEQAGAAVSPAMRAMCGIHGERGHFCLAVVSWKTPVRVELIPQAEQRGCVSSPEGPPALGVCRGDRQQTRSPTGAERPGSPQARGCPGAPVCTLAVHAAALRCSPPTPSGSRVPVCPASPVGSADAVTLSALARHRVWVTSPSLLCLGLTRSLSSRYCV